MLTVPIRWLSLGLVLAFCACSSGGSRPPMEHLRGEARVANVTRKGLGMQGFDPVSYHPVYGGKPRTGNPAITAEFDGVTYRFASPENEEAFSSNPQRFVPAYGGWCAWAMAEGEGSQVDIDPASFTIEAGRLYLFYDGWLADTRAKWKNKGGAKALAPEADSNWARFLQPQ